ncbi:uncharacterized protein LOC131162298 isoform X2 [Malania oleifera]|uniref:uncharacterized protein LOC131162298 isoform X2 n=1 Tax=Malania oleifera TaxID=397392 RepID=UPI0025ADC828|nr:uncharacterized protein LOC131162298 isoform X2 [Malania oleifera]
MSRIAKWKLEKTKVKVVFRLQFHATHIPQTGWDKLFISFIPADSGKATAKTTKANVRNGTCKWADPIYETTRLLQDAKTKSYDEKLYKIVVAMGSSRSSLLGEANINLADYADALKPFSVALPLHGTDSGTILHVTVQLLTSKTGFREFEQQRELRERGLTNTDQNNHYESAEGKVNARVRFRPGSKELPALEEEAGLTESTDSAVGFDGSSNTSESLYAEKHEISSAHNIDSLQNTVSGDLGGHSLNQSPQTEKGDLSDHQLHGWGSDYSMDNDLASAYEENIRLKSSLEVAESSISELKLEVDSLQSHTNEMGIETQKFAEQMAAEVASGEELAKEVSLLKSEYSKFKDDIELLKHSKLSPLLSSSETISAYQDHLFQDLQFRGLKGLLIIEDKLKELQDKAGFHQGDFGFLHPDFEALFGVLQDLKQGTGQTLSLLKTSQSEKANGKEISETGLHKNEKFLSGAGFGTDLYEPEGMLHCFSIPGLVSHEPGSRDASDAMKGKIFELVRELDESKAEKESLARKMDQMECYYEALVQELEENQKQMLAELQNLRNEHSTCLYTISSTKDQMETMHQEMSEHILRYAEDRQELESLNKELETRAVASEATLKRARLNYSIAVDQLQKDLELLSFQVLSMFETNESLIRQTHAEALQPCFQGCPNMAQNRKMDLKDSDTAALLKCQNQNAVARKQSLGSDMLLEDLKMSIHLQEELYRKVEEELCEMHVVNVHLDVFSKTLQGTLVEAAGDIRCMKEKLDELTQKLELSYKSEELLMLRLQNAMDDIHSLNEHQANCIARSNDIALQNQKLEAKLGNVTRENCLLRQKITESEALMQACAADKTELENLLKQESLRNGTFQNEISSLEEELDTVKTEFDDMASAKENLQKILNFLQDKLENLLESYDERPNKESLWSKSVSQNLELMDFMAVVSQLEELQQSTRGNILQLLDEKKDLEMERDIAQASLSTGKSEILIIRQTFEHDMQEMMNKLNASNALVQKLQLELEAMANRLEVRSEAEEKYVHQNTQLFSDLAYFKFQLEQVTSKNKDLAQEISALETVTEELGRSKLTIAEFTQENQVLMASLQDKTEESVKLALEVNNLKESLRCLQDDLHVERENRGNLEGLVTEFTHKLSEKHDQLLHFDQQKTELVRFKQMASDLEIEKSRFCDLLKHYEDRLQQVHEESSSITGLESQLSDMHELFIAADVQIIFTMLQYEAQFEELVQKFQSSNRNLRELHKQHIDVQNRLNLCLVSEERYVEENTRLSLTLESLSSDLDAFFTQNRVLLDTNSLMKAELEEYKNQASAMEVRFLEDKNLHAIELEQLNHMLKSFQEEIDNLTISNVELETKGIVLEAKLDEQRAQLTSQEECDNKLVMLQNQCNELTRRLSEQILKTEEFKNLSIHLKGLKDKSDAECLQARERREPEGPSVAMQDSLRIAFIKEQYETKLQELRHQLSISKKHGEEMLWKLQDAINELESRKKSEASHLKKNEDLSLKILELEAELQSVLSEKREKIKAFDQIKAELECLLISLECCKEEKQKVEASLQECNDEKSKITVELNLMKKLLDHSMSSVNVQKEGNDGSQEVQLMSGELFTGKGYQKNPVVSTPSHGIITMNVDSGNCLKGSPSKCLDQDRSMNCEEVDECSTANSEDVHPNKFDSMQPVQNSAIPKSVHGIPMHAFADQGNLLVGEGTQLAVMDDHFKAQSLKSCMDHLHKELERMIHDNSLFAQDNNFDPNFKGLQRELIQLHKANEKLGIIFPLFKEFPVSGNALERVIALEIELAEALQSKKKSSIHFQSSFLKQHSDEGAIFQSFRDINELIKDMLELRGRNAAVESELKEMHARYSQLSLQFAEVEGEREKLMMTLKNIRASKKPLHFNHAAAALGDHSS